MPEKSSTQFTGAIPEFYESNMVPTVFEPYARDLVARVPWKPGIRILELACGTGAVTRRLVEKLPADGKIVATDLNEAMIDVARTRVPDPRVEWRQADATTLPFKDGEFDVVVCQFGIMFFPDRPGALREAKRVLKKGGLLLFNTWDSLATNPFSRIAHEVVTRFYPSDPPMFWMVPFGYNDQATIRDDFRQGGFSSVEIIAVELPANAESAAHLATGLIRGTPMSLAILERGGAEVMDVEKRLADELAKLGGERPLKGSQQALVLKATS